MDKAGNKNLIILSFTLVIVTLGFGLAMPILPFYMEHFGAGGMELGFLMASYAVMRLIFGPIWGGLSDRVGRKPVLLIGVLGYGIAMAGFGLATRLWMLFAARILSGVLSSATSPTTMAYITDSTAEEDRSRGLGMLGAAGGIGAIFGPALGGLLAKHSLATPFFAAAGFSLLALLLILLLLPESLPAAERSDSNTQEPVFDLRAWWQALFSPMGPLLGLVFLATGGIMILYGILGLYALEVFNSGTEEVGWIFTVLGLVTVVGQGLLIGPLTRKFGDLAVIRFGFILSAVCLPLILLAGSYLELLVLIGLFSLVNAVLIPSITALTSKYSQISQGVTMGLSNSFVSLGRIVGPLSGGFLFDLHFAIPFWAGGVVMAAGAVFSVRLNGKTGPVSGDQQGETIH
ncbi:MAG: MFS transporter [Anaerolineales bacterium]|nr:MFS transporter [Anaerolineales bacterium]